MNSHITPPAIGHDCSIELFGKIGREEYYVDKVYFFKCEPINGVCTHDISINYYIPLLIGQSNSNTLLIHNVSYSDLVRKGYIVHLKKWNQVLITPLFNQENICQLIKVPNTTN
jgi:hypothetical protein